MGPGTSPRGRLRRDRQGAPPSMTQPGGVGPSIGRRTNNPQPPPTGRDARRLDGAAMLVPLMGSTQAFPLGTPPPPHPLVDCAELVNDAAFLDQYGARTPVLRNIMRTPPRARQNIVRRVFGVPERMESVCVEGEEHMVVRLLTDEPLQVKADQALPWAPFLIDPSPFPPGSAQRAVAEGAATKYGAPRLADIGGFFYHVVPRRRAVGAIGCADFAKPFVLPTGSTFKDIRGRANVVAVVYMPDPIGQLMPAQVSSYATHIGRIYSLKLPLRPGIATGPNLNWEFGNASSTPSPQLMDGTSSQKGSDDDYETMSTYPTGPNLTAFDPKFTHPFSAEGGGSLRRTARRKATVSTFSLSAHHDTASSTTRSQAGNVWASEARIVDPQDVMSVALGQVRAHENGSSEDSGSAHVLYATSPRSNGMQSPANRSAESSPFNAQRSPHSDGADRAAQALQEAEDAFMAADLKYDMAREAQDWDELDLNEPVDGSAAHVVDDETMAVEASQKRFWKAFDAELGLSSEDTELGRTLATLGRRRGSCMGLTPAMINNEVVALRECSSMCAYNTEFIVAAFNAIAKPDWWVWDVLEKCFPDEEDVTVWSAEALCSKLGNRLSGTVGDMASMEAVVDRLHMRRKVKSNSGAFKKESDYLVAYRNRNEAWNFYRLCAIRFDTLGDYRDGLRTLSTVPLMVHAGEELRALREYFTTAQRKGGVMLPFYVEYTIGDEGFDVNESGTVDCGGPTKRMLSSTWFQYWDNVGICMDIFSRAEQGHALHLRPPKNGRLTSQTRTELMFVGWFMFMLMQHGVRVSRPFIKATMAFACGSNPASPDDPTLSSWDADFIAYKPAVDSAFKLLMVGDIDSQRSACASVTVQDCPDLAWAIMDLEPGPGFVEAVEALRKRNVYKWLFQDCAVAGEALHTGFTLCIDNIVETQDLPLLQKKRILLTKEKFRASPQFFEPVFGADMGLNVEDFLGTCTYVDIKKAMQSRFEACVRGLPMVELQNLLFFITDSRYFTYAAIRIVGKPNWSQEKLPTSATCFNTLYMPLYENEALMAWKLSMATANCEGYGLI